MSTTKQKSATLPDPVVGSAGVATVKAWVDKDAWIDGAPAQDGAPTRYFVSSIIKRGKGVPPLEVDIHGMSPGEIANLGAALTQVALTTKGS